MKLLRATRMSHQPMNASWAGGGDGPSDGKPGRPPRPEARTERDVASGSAAGRRAEVEAGTPSGEQRAAGDGNGRGGAGSATASAGKHFKHQQLIDLRQQAFEFHRPARAGEPTAPQI